MIFVAARSLAALPPLAEARIDLWLPGKIDSATVLMALLLTRIQAFRDRAYGATVARTRCVGQAGRFSERV